jgi:hypothetical protein
MARRRKVMRLKNLLELHFSGALLEVHYDCGLLVWLARRLLTGTAFAGHEVGHGGLATLIGAVAGGESLSPEAKPLLTLFSIRRSRAGEETREEEKREERTPRERSSGV